MAEYLIVESSDPFQFNDDRASCEPAGNLGLKASFN